MRELAAKEDEESPRNLHTLKTRQVGFGKQKCRFDKFGKAKKSLLKKCNSVDDEWFRKSNKALDCVYLCRFSFGNKGKSPWKFQIM